MWPYMYVYMDTRIQFFQTFLLRQELFHYCHCSHSKWSIFLHFHPRATLCHFAIGQLFPWPQFQSSRTYSIEKQGSNTITITKQQHNNNNKASRPEAEACRSGRCQLFRRHCRTLPRPLPRTLIAATRHWNTLDKDNIWRNNNQKKTIIGKEGGVQRQNNFIFVYEAKIKDKLVFGDIS